ncbi:MAG: DUF2786 domain-containing protein [Microthrixaceae bacterium]
MTDDDRRLVTIRGLLAKAEATEFPDEAEAFFAKASELISRWSIDEAMLWADSDESTRERPDELRLVLHSPYLPQKAVLVGVVASGARVSCGQARVSSPHRHRDRLGRRVPVRAVLGRHAGHQSDGSAHVGDARPQARRHDGVGVCVLAAQLHHRFCRRGRPAPRGRPCRPRRLNMTPSARGGGAGGVAAAAEAASTALVLASRQDDVDDELRRRHPHLRSSYASSGRSAEGRRHGRAAGREASIGRRGLGARGALGRRVTGRRASTPTSRGSTRPNTRPCPTAVVGSDASPIWSATSIR